MNKQIISDDGNVISVIKIQDANDANDAKDANDTECCAICLEVIEGNKKVVGLDCSHKFHIHCMKEQLEAGLYQCSLCRDNITDTKIEQIYNEETIINELDSSHSFSFIKKCCTLSFSCNLRCSRNHESDIESGIHHHNTSVRYHCCHVAEILAFILLSPLIILYFILNTILENVFVCFRMNSLFNNCEINYYLLRKRCADILCWFIHLFFIFFISCFLRPVFFGNTNNKTVRNHELGYTCLITAFLYSILICCCWCCSPSRP